MRHLLLILSLFSILFAEEVVEDEPPLRIAGHGSDHISSLIGGLVSPLSGNPSLQKQDMLVMGTQELSVERVYIPPYMLHQFDWKRMIYKKAQRALIATAQGNALGISNIRKMQPERLQE